MNRKNKKNIMTYMSCLIFVLIFTGYFSKMTVHAEENVAVTIYHRHAGSSGGGGCYGSPRYCGGRMEERSLNPHGCGISASGGGCPHCGCYYEAPSAKYPSGCAHCNCPKPKETRCVNCGSGSGGSTCTRVTDYGVSCGKNESTPCAELTLKKNQENWTKELLLEASYRMIDSTVPLEALPFSWNDAGGVLDNTYLVQKNGTYQCKLLLGGTTNAREAKAALAITNIDILPPTIVVEKIDQTIFTKEQELIVVANDLQEDQASGCGLAEQAFSFDGGETWQAEANWLAKQNGDYQIQVRDNLDNVAHLLLTLKNIDITAPQMEVSKQGDQFSVSANDLQEDGTAGVGLAKIPYSFDGGNSWILENIKEIKQAGEHTLLVRDELGNTAEKNVIIEAKEDKGTPEKPQEVIPPVVEEASTESLSENEIMTQAPILEEKKKVPKKRIKDRQEETLETEVDPLTEVKSVSVEEELVKILEAPSVEVKGGNVMKVNSALVKAITITSITMAIGSIFFLLCYCFYFGAWIYSKIEGEKYRLIGFTLIRKEEEYGVTISDEVVKRAESSWGQVRLGNFFAKKHKLEPFIVQKGEDKMSYVIHSVIVVRLEL